MRPFVMICSAAVLALALAAPVPVMADAATPFYDSQYKVGETYTESARIVKLGAGRYLLVVASDQGEYYLVDAVGTSGVPSPDQLGKEVMVQAKVLSRNDKSFGSGRVEVEILAVTADK